MPLRHGYLNFSERLGRLGNLHSASRLGATRRFERLATRPTLSLARRTARKRTGGGRRRPSRPTCRRRQPARHRRPPAALVAAPARSPAMVRGVGLPCPQFQPPKVLAADQAAPSVSTDPGHLAAAAVGGGGAGIPHARSASANRDFSKPSSPRFPLPMSSSEPNSL